MLKLSVGFTKKVGEANYGSRGASVNLELELDGGLVGDADKLKERIRQLFGLAKASVEEELAVTPVGKPTESDAKANGNGHANGHAQAQRRDKTRPATASQVRALHAIAERRQLDLADLLTGRFGTRDPAEITITEASALIDELKTNGNGNGARR